MYFDYASASWHPQDLEFLTREWVYDAWEVERRIYEPHYYNSNCQCLYSKNDAVHQTNPFELKFLEDVITFFQYHNNSFKFNNDGSQTIPIRLWWDDLRMPWVNFYIEGGWYCELATLLFVVNGKKNSILQTFCNLL